MDHSAEPLGLVSGEFRNPAARCLVHTESFVEVVFLKRYASVCPLNRKMHQTLPLLEFKCF